MKRTMNRLRQGDFPTNPKSLADLGEIPEAFRKTSSGKNFLLYDSYDDDDDGEDDYKMTWRQKADDGREGS